MQQFEPISRAAHVQDRVPTSHQIQVKTAIPDRIMGILGKTARRWKSRDKAAFTGKVPAELRYNMPTYAYL